MSKVQPTDNPEKVLRQAIERIANSPDGVLFLQYIIEMTGYRAPGVCLSAKTGEVDALASMFDAGRRSVYVDLRYLLPYNRLAVIELPEPPQLIEEPEPNDRDDIDR